MTRRPAQPLVDGIHITIAHAKPACRDVERGLMEGEGPWP